MGFRCLDFYYGPRFVPDLVDGGVLIEIDIIPNQTSSHPPDHWQLLALPFLRAEL